MMDEKNLEYFKRVVEEMEENKSNEEEYIDKGVSYERKDIEKSF